MVILLNWKRRILRGFLMIRISMIIAEIGWKSSGWILKISISKFG